MGRTEDLFLRIKHGGANEVMRMIQQQIGEELFLDYKRAATGAPFGKLDQADRKNLAKAIADFANSEGGLESLIDSFVKELSQVFMLQVFPVGTIC